MEIQLPKLPIEQWIDLLVILRHVAHNDWPKWSEITPALVHELTDTLITQSNVIRKEKP